MAGELSTSSMVKFDGSNYQVWKFQILSILEAHGLDTLVEGKKEKPADLKKEDGIQWSKDNAKAKYILSTAMASDQLEN